MLAWPISRIVIATAVVALCAPATRAQNYNPYVTVDVIEDIPTPPPAHKAQPGPPEARTARPGLQNKTLGGPDTRPSADGTRWDFNKNSNFRLPEGVKAPKGPALKAR